MTVLELIEALKTFPQTERVYISDCDGDYYFAIASIESEDGDVVISPGELL